jgi:enoyl-CoA hydratase/carnithine racemase
LRRLVGSYRAERLMVAGAMLDSAQAQAIGLVDELVDTDFVVAQALAWARGLLTLPAHAMSGTRRLARADLAAIFADPGALPIEEFLDGWFAPEAQSVLRELVARLKSRAEA